MSYLDEAAERERDRRVLDRFRLWHRRCRDHLGRDGPGPKASAFTTNGFERLCGLTERQAKALRTYVASLEGNTLLETRFGDHLKQVRAANRSYVYLTFENILQGALDGRLVRFFRSEYMIYWFTITKVSPGGSGDPSFLWHRDWGPEAHAKVMVYLNPSSEHGGGTLFLDAKTTTRVDRAGYGFPPANQRVDDLGPFADHVGAPIRPDCEPMEAGEAVVFKPQQVLHRGVLPTREPRYVLTLCLRPSPIPWQDVLPRWSLPKMQAGPRWGFDFMAEAFGVSD